VAWYDYLNPVYDMQQLAGGTALPTTYANQPQIMGAINAGLAQKAPVANQSQSDQFRQGQMQQVGQLQGIASGQQEGAGELAAQRQTLNADANQQAMARMARGPNASMAYRNAANNTAGLGINGAGQAQQAALQDQMNAQGLLSSALGQGRSQDQQLSLANQQAQLQQGNLNLGYLSQLTGMDQAQLAAAVAAKQSSNQLAGGLMNTAGQLAGAGIMYSDERLKTGVRDAGGEMDALLDALHPKTYRYKDKRHGAGPRAGILAQDLERSVAGRRIVKDGPEGKALDVHMAVSAALAGAARLNERVRKLEGAR
jgi:hypothetical protein